MNEMIEIFEESAQLVQNWTSLKVGDETIQDYLRFKGISLWDIVAPSLAVYVLPEAISRSQNQGKGLSTGYLFEKKAKPYLRWVRNYIREYGEKRSAKERVSSSSKDLAKIMFLSFVPHRIEAFASVLDLLSGKSIEIKIMGSRYQLAKNRFLAGENREYIVMEDFFTKELAQRVKEGRKSLKERRHRLQKEQTFEKIEYQGVPLWKYIKDDFLNLFVHIFPQLIKQIEIADLILNAWRPDIIVGADDSDDRERVYFLMGRGRGLPTLLIQHGLASPPALYWKFMSTDKAAIFDDSTYQVLTEMGLEAKNLVVTGSPKFDRLVKGQSTKDEICHRLGINPKERVILFTPQPNMGDSFPSERIRKGLITTIYHSITGLEDTALIVKPHPDEDVAFHHHMKSRFNSVVVTERDFDTQELILACDVLITFHSTTTLEAMIADKPVILVKIPERPDPAQYFEKGATLVVGSEGSLVQALKSIFSDQDVSHKLKTARTNFIHKQKYMDGKASDRIAGLIYSMILRKWY